MIKFIRERGLWRIIHPQATVETESLSHACDVLGFMLAPVKAKK